MQCRLAVLALLISNLFLPRNPAFPTAPALNPGHNTPSDGHNQGNKATKYTEAHKPPSYSTFTTVLGPKLLPKSRVYLLAAELQAFSYSYLLFKELAAVKHQAGAHAYGCWEERSQPCLLWHVWSYARHLLLGMSTRAGGTRTSGGVWDTHTLQTLTAHTKVQTARDPGSDSLKLNRSWYGSGILKEEVSSFFQRVLEEESPGLKEGTAVT